MTLATDQAAAQAQFQADFNQFKIDFSALVTALRTAKNEDDEAALEASIGNLQTMDADLKGLDSTAVSATAPTVPAPAPAPAPTPIVDPAPAPAPSGGPSS